MIESTANKDMLVDAGHNEMPDYNDYEAIWDQFGPKATDIFAIIMVVLFGYFVGSIIHAFYFI